jgi:hypothetical protein
LSSSGVSTGVAEHVRVRLEVEARRPFNHPGKAGRGERGFPLAGIDAAENAARSRRTSPAR